MLPLSSLLSQVDFSDTRRALRMQPVANTAVKSSSRKPAIW